MALANSRASSGSTKPAFASVTSGKWHSSEMTTEALAARAPVVISDECHFPEVTEANAGFVLPLDAREFANAICKTASNPQLGREMGQAGRQLIESRYTWPRVAQIAIEAYQRAIGK